MENNIEAYHVNHSHNVISKMTTNNGKINNHKFTYYKTNRSDKYYLFATERINSFINKLDLSGTFIIDLGKGSFIGRIKTLEINKNSDFLKLSFERVWYENKFYQY